MSNAIHETMIRSYISRVINEVMKQSIAKQFDKQITKRFMKVININGLYQ